MANIHFNLSQFAPTLNTQQVTTTALFIEVNGERVALQAHDDKSLTKSEKSNLAVKWLREQQQAPSHYCDLPESALKTHEVSLLKITGDTPKGVHSLPTLYGLSYHVPAKIRQRLRKRLAKQQVSKRALVHPKLEALNCRSLAQFSGKERAQLFVDADEVITPWDTAKALIFQHPEMATNKAFTAGVVLDQHIAPPSSINPSQYNRIYELAIEISRQGPATEQGGWSTIRQAETPDGELMFAEYDLKDGQGDLIYEQGEPVMYYDLSDPVAASSGSPVSNALQTCRSDTLLQNEQWTSNLANELQTEEVHHEQAAQRQKRTVTAVQAGVSAGFMAMNKTPHHGLEVYSDSINFQPDANEFAIDVKNTYLRQLGSFVEFYTDTQMQQPIANPEVDGDWPFYFPEELAELFETETKKAVGTVPNVNTIMGIPMPTDPTTVSIPWPDEAQAVRLMFGGLGTSNWDNNVVWPGAILTGLFNIGMPLFFMAAGAAITNTSFYRDFVSDKENVIAAAAVGAPILAGGTTVAAALGNTKKVLFTLANTFAGMLVKKGFEKLATTIMAKLVAAQAKNAIPIVGLAFRIASIALDLAQIATTIGQTLSSPAVLDVDIIRQMQLNFELHPDPEHGEPGRPETAIWPLVGETCEVIVDYKNGDSYKQIQKLPDVSSNTPLTFIFEQVGWGGEFTISANVYSQNGWLCGKYRSDNLAALPDNPETNTIKFVQGNIVEQLVPLTANTQYQYKQKLGYNANDDRYEWIVDEVPTETKTALSCANVGDNLCELVSMTVNQKAYQAGYVYRASNQNIPLEDPESPLNSGQMYVMQNISLLSAETLNERLKFSEVGFKVQPGIAYDCFGEGPSEDEISPLNFVLDSRNGEYHVRHVDLMNFEPGFGFDQPDLKSYGRFYIPHLDAMVIHPSGYLIAASWQASKLQILKLPSEPVADHMAPEAQIVSGQGALQGLTYGPKAITVTPDGRVLVLESVNRRVQAFDTKGNPVPSYPDTELFTVPATDYAADLNESIFSEALKEQFIAQGLTHLFDFDDTSLVPDLNAAVLNMTIIQAFAEEGVYLTYEETAEGEITPEGSTYIDVTTVDSAWKVIDPNKNATYLVTREQNNLAVNVEMNNVVIEVIGADQKWVIKDMTAAAAYLLITSGTPTITVLSYLSYMSLTAPSGAEVNYLDLISEAKGYTYVLSYENRGENNSDYFVDVYDPDGEFLVRTPDERLYSDPNKMQYIATARLALDQWRNLFTLNYEHFQGRGEKTEPTISTWIPTTPLFDTEPEQISIFQAQDIPAVTALFAEHDITLSTQVQIEIINNDGHFLVDDVEEDYDCILSLNDSGEQRLFVYDLIA